VFDYLGSPVFSPGVAAVVVLLLGSVGFAAGYFPSRRAAAIQPAVALRCE
jgi:ABC-type antimicrobial peptide transport system permease subunit